SSAARPTRSSEQQGPRFEREPPGLVEFTNSKEASVPCQASGRPAPAVRWIKLPDAVTAAEVPGLRYVRPDGTLVFPKFAPKDLRQDVHSALYRCVATNSVGAVASRDVRVKAGELLCIPFGTLDAYPREQGARVDLAGGGVYPGYRRSWKLFRSVWW
ncbi:unnamed protein product, partial [Ixodes persulcatus]